MKSKNIPILAAILIPALAVIFSLGFVYYDKITSASSSRELFPYDAYMRSPKNLEGNTYAFLGTIDAQLSRTPNGRVVSVRDSVGNPRFAVFVPDTLGKNIMANQKYKFGVNIAKGGAIVVDSMGKF